MQAKHPDDDLNLFAELLRVMNFEDLLRCRRRLENAGRTRMVEILTDEIEEREAIDKATATARKAS